MRPRGYHLPLSFLLQQGWWQVSMSNRPEPLVIAPWPVWPANIIMLFFLNFHKSRTVIRLVITGVSRSFVSKVVLETCNSEKLRHSPLCYTEDISLISFLFEWLLEEGAVLQRRGHNTWKKNAWQWTVTHTKKTHDNGLTKKTRDREPWHIQRKRTTWTVAVLGNEECCAQSIWTAGKVVRQDQKLASGTAATYMCTHTHSHADTHAHRGSTSSSNKPGLLDPFDFPAPALSCRDFLEC